MNYLCWAVTFCDKHEIRDIMDYLIIVIINRKGFSYEET